MRKRTEPEQEPFFMLRTNGVAKLIAKAPIRAIMICAQATRKLHQAFIFNGNHTATRRSKVAHTTMNIAKSVPLVN